MILVEGNKVECRIGHDAGRCAYRPGPDEMNRDVSVARARSLPSWSVGQREAGNEVDGASWR